MERKTLSRYKIYGCGINRLTLNKKEKMENYLYFAEAAVETGGATNPEAMLIPASSYLGCDPESTTITIFKFKALDGTATIETIALTHTINRRNKSLCGNYQFRS